MILTGRDIGVWIRNGLSLFIGAGIIGLIAIRGIDLKLKYNIIYGLAILRTLLIFLGVVSYYVEFILIRGDEGFIYTQGMNAMLILTIIGAMMFIFVGIIGKLQARKL
ncbi:MAG: hypothetical protein GF311_13215 [Candidatus Lokiarchaeota archaeon]|nr:hypothetical protein [Candidatus Lokiarchaeota archaeon]